MLMQTGSQVSQKTEEISCQVPTELVLQRLVLFRGPWKDNNVHRLVCARLPRQMLCRQMCRALPHSSAPHSVGDRTTSPGKAQPGWAVTLAPRNSTANPRLELEQECSSRLFHFFSCPEGWVLPCLLHAAKEYREQPFWILERCYMFITTHCTSYTLCLGY